MRSASLHLALLEASLFRARGDRDIVSPEVARVDPKILGAAVDPLAKFDDGRRRGGRQLRSWHFKKDYEMPSIARPIRAPRRGAL